MSNRFAPPNGNGGGPQGIPLMQIMGGNPNDAQWLALLVLVERIRDSNVEGGEAMARALALLGQCQAMVECRPIMDSVFGNARAERDRELEAAEMERRKGLGIITPDQDG